VREVQCSPSCRLSGASDTRLVATSSRRVYAAFRRRVHACRRPPGTARAPEGKVAERLRLRWDGELPDGWVPIKQRRKEAKVRGAGGGGAPPPVDDDSPF
jgi:hypothetical protein